MKEFLTCKGNIQAVIENKSGSLDVIEFRNTILKTGRSALAFSLANRIGGDFDFFVSRMIFGDGGTNGSIPKIVPVERNGLFGSKIVDKPVVANIDSSNDSQVIFTSVVSFNEGNGFNLNEMALVLQTGDLYSMATFPGVSKTPQMQITFNWKCSFI
jgi:hypothetical protein